jgi:hypothetical protein
LEKMSHLANEMTLGSGTAAVQCKYFAQFWYGR